MIGTYAKTHAKAKGLATRVIQAAQAARTKTAKLAADRDVQRAAASGAVGAVGLGAGGAGVGMLTGGAVGAAVGVVPAFFTLGLSIPFCAVVGGGCGFATGAVV